VVECMFELNDKPMSALKCRMIEFEAFSGLGEYVNRKSFSCAPDFGPIPAGSYYIVDRESGGLLGALRDHFNGREKWFALYAADNRVDDETFCDKVKRGQFRLHPKGPLGISQGCIVINDAAQFLTLRGILKSAPPAPIPGTKWSAYGRLTVK